MNNAHTISIITAGLAASSQAAVVSNSLGTSISNSGTTQIYYDFETATTSTTERSGIDDFLFSSTPGIDTEYIVSALNPYYAIIGFGGEDALPPIDGGEGEIFPSIVGILPPIDGGEGPIPLPPVFAHAFDLGDEIFYNFSPHSEAIISMVATPFDGTELDGFEGTEIFNGNFGGGNTYAIGLASNAVGGEGGEFGDYSYRRHVEGKLRWQNDT